MSNGGNASEYRVTVTTPAQRDLKRLVKSLSRDRFLAIDDAIRSLGRNPRPHGYEPLEGCAGVFRFRVGDHRILYSIDDPMHVVRIARVRDRKDVYRH